MKSEREKYVIEHTCGSQFESFSCTDEDSQAEDDEDEDEARSDHYPSILFLFSAHKQGSENKPYLLFCCCGKRVRPAILNTVGTQRAVFTSVIK